MTARVWTYHDTTTTIAHTNAANIIDFSANLRTQIGYNPSDVTVQRIVGHVQISAPASSTAYDGAKIFLGIVPVDDEAAGGAVYPEPYADSIPWLWTHGGQVWVPDNPSASLATPVIPDHIGSPHIDIQAQRRIKGRHVSLRMVGYDDSGITGTLNISVTARCLWLLRG